MRINPVKILNYCCTKNIIQFGKVFDVRKLENLYCPVCGSTMFNKEQGARFCHDMSCSTGKRLVKAIEKYENMNKDDALSKDLPVFNTRHQEILNRVKVAALENEDLYLDEITYIFGKEVANKYSTPSPRDILSSYTTPCKNSRPILSDEDYADIFFLNCRNRGYSSYEIAHEIIKNKYPTIEHIVPVCKKGKNADSNYLCDCNECNSNRGSMSFYKWIHYIPSIGDNLQIQMNQINQALNNSILDSNYKYYPKKLAKTVKTQSKGEINLIV